MADHMIEQLHQNIEKSKEILQQSNRHLERIADNLSDRDADAVDVASIKSTLRRQELATRQLEALVLRTEKAADQMDRDREALRRAAASHQQREQILAELRTIRQTLDQMSECGEQTCLNFAQMTASVGALTLKLSTVGDLDDIVVDSVVDGISSKLGLDEPRFAALDAKLNSIQQNLPRASDLLDVKEKSDRTVAGIERIEKRVSRERAIALDDKSLKSLAQVTESSSKTISKLDEMLASTSKVTASFESFEKATTASLDGVKESTTAAFEAIKASNSETASSMDSLQKTSSKAVSLLEAGTKTWNQSAESIQALQKAIAEQVQPTPQSPSRGAIPLGSDTLSGIGRKLDRVLSDIDSLAIALAQAHEDVKAQSRTIQNIGVGTQSQSPLDTPGGDAVVSSVLARLVGLAAGVADLQTKQKDVSSSLSSLQTELAKLGADSQELVNRTDPANGALVTAISTSMSSSATATTGAGEGHHNPATRTSYLAQPNTAAAYRRSSSLSTTGGVAKRRRI